MKIFIKLLIILVLVTFTILPAQCAEDEIASMKVCNLQTNYGNIQFRFFEDAAPKTSTKFEGLVKVGFYDSLKFYRVVQGHVIQAGDGGENDIPTVEAEFNKYPHIVGTVGLARSEDPNSGSTEFYICLAPRPHLDGKYTVFGQLTKGYDILKKIGEVEIVEQFIGEEQNIAFHTPAEPVIIEKATIDTIMYFVK